MTLKEEYLKKYKRCIMEYTNLADDVVNEVGEDSNALGAAPAPADPAAAGAPAPGMDPMAGGAAPADPMAAGAAPADPMAAGAAPGAMPGAPAPGMDPMAGGAAPAEPAPVDPEAEMKKDNAPGGPITPQPQENGEQGEQVGEEEAQEEDSEREDMEKEQEKAMAKIEKLASKFEKVFDEMDSIKQRLEMSSEKIDALKSDMEKRNPTPEEKLSLRSRNYSAPFSQPMDEYWDEKEADSNYSTEDDKDGEDMEEYKITKSDIGHMNDWRSISKSFDDERFGLKGILGY